MSAALLSGCTTATGGDGYAASLAERVAIAVGDDITPPFAPSRSAEYLAARAIESPRLPSTSGPTDITVDVLGWGGESGLDEGATIDLRVSVHVHRTNARSIGESGVAEGFSTRCWTLTILTHSSDNYVLDEVECPEGAVAKTPTPAALPSLPEDTEARFAVALADATLATAESRVREQFPDDFYVIEIAEVFGEIVAAVGIPTVRDCAVGVRSTEGAVGVLSGFDREQLMPGELGCSTRLYVPAPKDFGPRLGAQGEAVAAERGGFLYTVVEGDAPVEIQQRFGLYSLFQIQKADGLPVGDNIAILVGEQLSIVPYSL